MKYVIAAIVVLVVTLIVVLNSATADAEKPAATAPATQKHDDHDHDAHDHGDEPKHDDHDHGDEHDHHGEIRLTAEAIRTHGVRIGRVSKSSAAASLSAPARVAFNAEAMAHVGSPLEGRVVELKVRTGDTVSAGQELLIIESPALGEAQSDYLQKRTALTVAESAVEPAQSAALRARKLYELNQGIALAELQRRESEAKSAEGTLLSARAALAAAAHRLTLLGMDEQSIATLSTSGAITPRYTLRAPIAGTVIEREATLGELVSPDREALLVLADVSNLWVLVDVPEARLAEVTIGASAKVFIAGAKQPTEGEVAYVSPAVDPNTRTGRVRIVVADKSLRPGMFARAELSLGGEATVGMLAVPEEAIQIVNDEYVVFVPVDGEPNTFTSKCILIGPSSRGMRPVTTGLEEGEEIVIAGSFILKAELGKAEASHGH